MLEYGSPQQESVLPKRRTVPLFNPNAQLDTSRMSDAPDSRAVDPFSQTFNLPSPVQLEYDRVQPNPYQATQFLRSKLDRVGQEPDINKLLLLFKMLRS